MAKQLGFFVLLHDDHPAIMEILDDTEYRRIKAVEPEFKVIAHTATKGEALDIIMEKLRLAYLEDPTMQRAKQIIRDSLNQ